MRNSEQRNLVTPHLRMPLGKTTRTFVNKTACLIYTIKVVKRCSVIVLMFDRLLKKEKNMYKVLL